MVGAHWNHASTPGVRDLVFLNHQGWNDTSFQIPDFLETRVESVQLKED